MIYVFTTIFSQHVIIWRPCLKHFTLLGEMMDLKMLSLLVMDDGGDEEKKKLMIMY